MSVHNDVGNFGEARAASFLESHGYTIEHIGWRHRRFEIDIVATKDEILHFIEVKTRTNDQFGLPEKAVTRQKMQKMKAAANDFCRRHGTPDRLQFDVIAISLTGPREDIVLFADVWL